MSLTLLNTPQKEIIICAGINSFFVSDVSELDFRWTLANQQSVTKNITVTNVGTMEGTLLSISLPSGFFTTQTFPQNVAVGGSVVIPIYFLSIASADYSNNVLINGDLNIVTVSLLGGVQSKGLQFDGVNDYVISTQDVSWERNQPFTFYAKYKNINWAANLKNSLFQFSVGLSAAANAIYFGGAASSDMLIRSSATNQLVATFANRSMLPSTGVIQITYSGNSLLSGFRFFVNDLENGVRGINQSETLTTNIVTSSQKALIGQTNNSVFFTPNSKLQEISFVNYVKSAGERTTDYNNDYQSKGSGDYLFRQSFNVGGAPLALKADVLGGSQVDMTIIGQTTGDFVNF
jgi:hypothetical protein